MMFWLQWPCHVSLNALGPFIVSCHHQWSHIHRGHKFTQWMNSIFTFPKCFFFIIFLLHVMLIRPHCWLCLLTPSCGRIKRFVCESMTTRVGGAKWRPWVPLHQQSRPHLKCDITNSQLFTPSDIRTIADYIARSEQIGKSLSLSFSAAIRRVQSHFQEIKL